jgi:RecA-family ATPase
MLSLLLSRDNSVGIATGYGLDSLGSIPDRGKIFLISTSSRPESTLHPLRWVPKALSQEVNLRETDRLSLSGAEVTNTWIYTSTPPYVFMTYFLIS